MGLWSLSINEDLYVDIAKDGHVTDIAPLWAQQHKARVRSLAQRQHDLHWSDLWLGQVRNDVRMHNYEALPSGLVSLYNIPKMTWAQNLSWGYSCVV